MPVNPKPARAETPQAVRILAWLQILQGLGTLLVGLAHTLAAGSLLGGVPQPLPFVAVGEDVPSAFARGAFQLLLAFPILWVGLALFRLRRFAWLSAMSLQGVVLLLNLVSHFRGGANYASMAISVLIVLYLNNAEVREALQARNARDDATDGGAE
jgi:hypothetical protein